MRRHYPIHLTTKPIHFWSKNDELSFLGWVERIRCVAAHDGTAFWEEIKIMARPTNGELHDLIGLFTRYGIPLKQLAQFVDKRNEAYFRTPTRDWYAAMFVDDVD
jgi:hypothetical protein